MKFECMKLLRNKVYLILLFCLLTGNVLLIYMQEYKQTRYHYVYENRSQYEKFLAGDEAVEGADVYMLDAKKQEAYLAAYPQFLNEMEQRAEKQEKLKVYEKGSYAYRNLEKTCEDYRKLSGVELEAGNNYGIEAYTGYNTGIVFLLCFLLISVYYVVYEERGRGLFLLTKGTKHGHADFAVRKGFFLCLIAGIYTLIQELMSVAVFGYWYGYGELQRSIQSVSLFRNCSYRMNIGEMLASQICIRISIAVLLAAVLYLIGICVRNEILALAVSAGILGALYVCSIAFPLYGSLNGVRCTNPFFVWDAVNVFGTYLNLNLFGYPFGKNCVAVIAGLIVAASAFGVGVFVFHKTCQIRSKSRLEKLLHFLQKKMAWRWHHTNLFWFEVSKLLIGQRRGVVLIALLIWCVHSFLAINGVHYYPTAELMTYHNFLNEIHGRIIDESLEYVETQIMYIDDLYNQMEELVLQNSENNTALVMSLQHELEIKEDATWRLKSQRDCLLSGEGNIYDKYFVDEAAYCDIWDDVTGELVRWFACACAIVLFVSGIFAFDEKKGLNSLLSTTANGGRLLCRKQKEAGWFGACMLIGLAELPVLYEYWKIDEFTCLSHWMKDFTTLSLSGNLTLGGFIAITMILRMLSLAVVAYLGMKLAQFMKTEIVACVAGIGFIGCVFLLLYMTQTDITGMVLYMQM